MGAWPGWSLETGSEWYKRACTSSRRETGLVGRPPLMVKSEIERERGNVKFGVGFAYLKMILRDIYRSGLEGSWFC